MSELLPCPFCGGEASKRLFYGARYGVYCDECDARVCGLFNTEDEAIEAWNTRAGNTVQLIQELEDARAEIRKLERRGEYMVRQIAKAKEALR